MNIRQALYQLNYTPILLLIFVYKACEQIYNAYLVQG